MRTLGGRRAGGDGCAGRSRAALVPLRDLGTADRDLEDPEDRRGLALAMKGSVSASIVYRQVEHTVSHCGSTWPDN